MLQMVPGNQAIEHDLQDLARGIHHFLDILLIDSINLHQHTEP